MQQQQLLAAYPDSFCVIHLDELIWQGDIQPTLVSRRYRTTVRYRLGKRPDVTIINPCPRAIVDASDKPGRKLPHAYQDTGDPLCLFFGMNEWNPSMALADTIPWTSLWLRFFEVWLVTNTWEGSGATYAG